MFDGKNQKTILGRNSGGHFHYPHVLIHFKDFLLKTSKNFSRSKNIDSFERRQQDKIRKIEMTLEQKDLILNL